MEGVYWAGLCIRLHSLMVFGFFGIGRGVALSTAGVGYYDVVIS